MFFNSVNTIVPARIASGFLPSSTGNVSSQKEGSAVIFLVLSFHVFAISTGLEPESPPDLIKEIEVQIEMPVVMLPTALTLPPPPVPIVPPPPPKQLELPKPVQMPVVQDIAPVAPVIPIPAEVTKIIPPPIASPPQLSKVVPIIAPPAPITEPDYRADYLNNPAPAYPLVARRMGYQGKVLLNVEVLAEGRAGQVLLQTSSGREALDNAAIQTVKNWRFLPARQAGRAVTKWFFVPISFSLKDSEA